MSIFDIPEKAAEGRSRNDYPAKDQHPADVKAALEKKGWSLRRLSKHHGFTGTYLSVAFAKSAPMAEGLIAEALGLHPKHIWPSRYDHAGYPKVPIKRGRVVPKNIPPRRGRHVPNEKAA